jgi:hypothetical protein
VVIVWAAKDIGKETVKKVKSVLRADVTTCHEVLSKSWSYCEYTKTHVCMLYALFMTKCMQAAAGNQWTNLFLFLKHMYDFPIDSFRYRTRLTFMRTARDKLCWRHLNNPPLVCCLSLRHSVNSQPLDGLPPAPS